MTYEERNSYFQTITELSEMNRVLNIQAQKIERRAGEYWKSLSNQEIEKKVHEYDLAIVANTKEICLCLKELSKEYGIGL